MSKVLLFYPQGDMINHTSEVLPSPLDVPLGTWAYVRGRPDHISPWSQVVMFTVPIRIKWEHYSKGEEPDELPPKARMLALVMP